MNKIRYFILTLVGAVALTATGAPASGVPVQVTAPDGTKLWVRAVGDENNRHFETLDGELVSWLPQVRQQLFPKALKDKLFPRFLNQRQSLANRTVPASGSPKFLVVLVDFPDRQFAVEEPLAVFSELLNATSADGNQDPGSGIAVKSARSYFEASSAGQFSPDFQLVGPVTMANNARYYASVGLDDSPATNMVIEACQILDSEVDFTEFDLDGDGICDNVYFFYAGQGQADGGGTSTIWPHSATLSTFGKSLTIDGIAIENYACSPEQNGRKQFTGIGTFCHEFCHVLGLKDLYCNGGLHPGYFSLMASGNYNDGGYTPPLLSSFERLSLGWLTTEELAASGDVTLSPLSDSNHALRLSTPHENEYFLLENRPQQGWDSHLPGEGLLIWHIDYDQQAWDNNTPNTSAFRRVDLLRAVSTGGAFTPFPGPAGVTTISDTTTPSLTTHAGESLGVTLSEIAFFPSPSVAGETSLVTFSALFTGAGVNDTETDPANDPVTAVYSISGQILPTTDPAELPPGFYILRRASGATSKCRK